MSVCKFDDVTFPWKPHDWSDSLTEIRLRHLSHRLKVTDLEWKTINDSRINTLTSRLNISSVHDTQNITLQHVRKNDAGIYILDVFPSNEIYPHVELTVYKSKGESRCSTFYTHYSRLKHTRNVILIYRCVLHIRYNAFHSNYTIKLCDQSLILQIAPHEIASNIFNQTSLCR